MNQTFFTAKVSFLPCVNCQDKEIKTYSLGHLVLSPKWRKEIETIRAEADPAKQKELKDALPCFTPAGTFSHVCKNGLIKPSSFLCADIDCDPEKGINTALKTCNLKEDIARLPFVAYCGRSCRGTGYFLIIPIADPSKYRDYYKALQEDFEKGGITLDPSCKDISRKRFVSWDPDPYINTAATPYNYTLPEREHTTREILGHDIDATETAAKVDAVIRSCENNNWDITADYSDWVRILAALAGTFGENGRNYAHRISALYSGYSYEQTDAKYSSFLNNRRSQEHPAGIGTFFYIARQEIGKHDFDNLSL